VPYLRDLKPVRRNFHKIAYDLYRRNNLGGRDLINLRKKRVWGGGRRGIYEAVKVRTKRDYSCYLRREFQRN
jgi:hypothetical protein